jgi:NACHT NTPase-like protein
MKRRHKLDFVAIRFGSLRRFYHYNMSGVEALAVVGIIANIIQLADFSVNVIERARGFSSKVVEVPVAFKSLYTVLPLLSLTLSRTMDRTKSNELSENTCKALKPVILGCQTQLLQLEKILKKLIPSKDALAFEIFWKSLASTREDK